MTAPIDISPATCTADSPGEAEQTGGALSIPRLGVKTAVDLRLLREMAEGLRHNAAIFRDQNSRARERQLYDTASAICNAADELEQLRTALTASEKDAEELRWLKAHPDEFVSAVDDAYGQWGGGEPAEFAYILGDEIKHQRSKV